MSNVVHCDFAMRCPPGSLALHGEYGLCRVIDARGSARSLAVDCETADGRLGGAVEVCVGTLSPIDPGEFLPVGSWSWFGD